MFAGAGAAGTTDAAYGGMSCGERLRGRHVRPGTGLAAHVAIGRLTRQVGLSIVLEVEGSRTFRRVPEVGGIDVSPQTEVGEVVQVEAEDLVAVGHVLARVEDVGVPEVIDVERRHDRFPGGHGQEEKTLVDRGDAFSLLPSPSVSFAGMGQLEDDRLQIETREGDFDLFGGTSAHGSCSLSTT